MFQLFKRRSSICFLVAFLLILISGSISHAQDSRIDEELKDNRAIINPLKLALGEAEYNKAMASGEYTYTGNLKCRLCHRDFFMGRKKDAHEHSFKKSIDSKFASEPKCLACHSTGYGAKTGFTSIRETPKLANVQCEGCHGPGSKHNEMNSKGGFLAGTDNPGRILKMCKACHSGRWNHRPNNIEVAYEDYKKAEANAAGR